MTQEKIQMFLMSNQNKFESSQVPLIVEQLQKLDDEKLMVLTSVKYKEPTTVLILSLFFGGLGVDRFVLGDVGIGILKLLTGGCFGILTIIDWFLVTGKAKKRNFELFTEAVNMQNVYVPSKNTYQNVSDKNNVEEIKKYKQLFDAGAITEEEFVSKKKELLR